MLTLSATLFFSCSKNESSDEQSKARLEVYLTDDPANYDEVVIDVQDVKINYSNDETQAGSSKYV